MAKITVDHDRDYTVLNNEMFKNKGLSLKARGLLATMLSFPDGWDYSTRGLTKILKEGKDTIASCLKELEDEGYLVRVQCRSERGKFERNEYTLFEKARKKPDTENPLTENPLPEKPDTEKPSPENPPQLNTNKLSNKELSNKKNKVPKNEDIVGQPDSTAEAIKTIVLYLNQKIGTNYSFKTKNTVKHINARLSEGYVLEDFVKVIDKKVDEWGKDPKMVAYLRPNTLFGTKFESYLNQKVVFKNEHKAINWDDI